MAESQEGPAKPSFSLSFLRWDHSFLGLPLSVYLFPSPASLSIDPISLIASLDQWPPNGSLAFSG